MLPRGPAITLAQPCRMRPQPRGKRQKVVGGELKGQTKALIDSRQQVVERMVAEAELKGANAVIAMRFDASEIGNGWAEICAYGTACRVSKA